MAAIRQENRQSEHRIWPLGLAWLRGVTCQVVTTASVGSEKHTGQAVVSARCLLD
jgi:hypothetical protein